MRDKEWQKTGENIANGIYIVRTTNLNSLVMYFILFRKSIPLRKAFHPRAPTRPWNQSLLPCLPRAQESQEYRFSTGGTKLSESGAGEFPYRRSTFYVSTHFIDLLSVMIPPPSTLWLVNGYMQSNVIFPGGCKSCLSPGNSIDCLLRVSFIYQLKIHARVGKSKATPSLRINSIRSRSLPHPFVRRLCHEPPSNIHEQLLFILLIINPPTKSES